MTTKGTHPKDSRWYHIAIFCGAAIVLIAGGAWQGGRQHDAAPSEVTAIETLRTEISGMQTALRKTELESIQDTVSQAARKAAPTIVAIRPAENIPPLRQIPTYPDYANGARATAPSIDLGSGLSGILIADGTHVLTSANVSAMGSLLRVALDADTEFTADLLAVDREEYLAILKLREKPSVPPIQFDGTGQFEAGGWLIRVGRSPAGKESLSLSLLESVRSIAPGRAVGLLDSMAPPEVDGGGLLDVRGRIVGIYVAPPNQRAFAIPIHRALEVSQRLLMESNTASRSRAGLELQELTEDLKEHFGITNGALVVRVQRDGPAARAGIQSMDLIVKLGDLDVTSARELTAGINGTPPETELQLTIRRGVRERSLQLKTEAIPPVPEEKSTADTEEGISIRIVESGISEGGVSIGAISPEVSANRLGLRTGDAIRAVNGTTVRNRSDFLRLQRTTSGKSQLWEVWRFDRVFFVAVRERVTVL